MRSTTMQRAGAVLTACLLASCGGGGGGGDSGDGVKVTLDKSSVTFMTLNESTATNERVRVTISGGSGTYYIAASSSSEPFQVSADVKTTTEADVFLTPTATTASNLGIAQVGQITVQLCSDAACAHVAWTRTIPYTINRFRIELSSIVLTGTEGVAATPVSLAITPPDTGHQFSFTSSNPAAMTVDHTDPAKVTLTLATPRASTLSATLGVAFPGSESVFFSGLQVPVQLKIDSDIQVPPITPFMLKADTQAPSLAAIAPVTFAAGQNQTWSASSDKPWLVLDAASGTGAGTLRFHVDPSRVDSAKNWSSDVATISVSSAGLSTLQVPVSLLEQLPEISSSQPAAVLAGQPATVHVTGRGLSQLADLGRLSVGGVPVSGGSVFSDTAATLQLPALAAGPARIAVSNSIGAAVPSAPLGVEAPGTYAAAFVPNAGLIRSVVFDPFRQALYAANMGSDYSTASPNALQRYQLVGSSWQVTTLAVDRIGYVALSPDHATVWVGSDTHLLAVDPDTMQVRASVALPDGRSTRDLSYYFGGPMPVTSNGLLWLNPSFSQPAGYYDMRAGTFGTLYPPDVPGASALYEPSVFGTPAGTGMFMASCLCATPTGPSYWYDVASGNFTHPAAIQPADEPVFDDAGKLMVANGGQVYRTDDFALVGRADVHDDPAPNAQYSAGYNTLLSPDGRRAYSFVQPFMQQQIDHLAVFDTTTLVPGTTDFVYLGDIALPDKATTCLGSQGVPLCDSAGRQVMDPTGSTLFWLGERGLVVLPIPPAMSGLATTSRAHAAATVAAGGHLARATSLPARH